MQYVYICQNLYQNIDNFDQSLRFVFLFFYPSRKEKALEEARLKLQKSETEKQKLSDQLDEATKEKEKVNATMKTLEKVLETVNANIETKKTPKTKKKIKCRDINKPTGCAWGTCCRFDHGDEPRLVKQTDCSYWMDGHCRYEEKVCWNIHNPEKKGCKSAESPKENSSGFQEGQEQRGPEQQSSAEGMDSEGWVEPLTRKKKKQMKAITQAKERQSSLSRSDGKTAQNFPTVGGTGATTPTFPMDGDQNQQILLQVLRTLLQSAGGGQ